MVENTVLICVALVSSQTRCHREQATRLVVCLVVRRRYSSLAAFPDSHDVTGVPKVLVGNGVNCPRTVSNNFCYTQGNTIHSFLHESTCKQNVGILHNSRFSTVTNVSRNCYCRIPVRYFNFKLQHSTFFGRALPRPAGQLTAPFPGP